MAKVQSAFAQMKSQGKSLTEKLNSELDKINSSGRQKDPAFWEPTVGADGNGFAIIRFLPAAQGEEVPFVRRFEHQFKGPGGWYVENSRTTLPSPDNEDPVSQHNRELWATDTDKNKEIVRQRKRKLALISNIYVVKDSSNPEAEGKVFKYKYGKKIWDKITDAMTTVEAEGKVGYNPFHLWDGANFKLRIRTLDAGPGKKGFRNYDKSEFDACAPLADDAKMEDVWSQCHPLLVEIAPDKFKPYDELKAKFEKVIGLGRTSASNLPKADAPMMSESTPKQPAQTDIDGLGGDEAEDPDLARFRAMAKDD